MAAPGSAAQRLVSFALAAGADHAEAFLQERRGFGAEVERDVVRGVVAAREAGFGIRVVRRGRVGFSYGTDFGRAKAVASGAVRAARHGRPGGAFPAPAKTRPVPGLFDPRTARATPSALCGELAGMVDAAKSVRSSFRVAGAGVSVSEERVALANDAGVRLEERGTHASASIYGVLGRGERDASTGSAFVSSRAIGPRWRLGEEAARLAVAAARPRKIASRAYDVLLAPEAAGELFELVARSMRAEPMVRGQSPFPAAPGDRVADEQVDLFDDPRSAGGISSCSFDDEGIPTKRTFLVRDGIRVGHLASLADRWRFGFSCTGSALRPGGEGRSFRGEPRALGRCLRLEAERFSKEELFEEAGSGLFVHDLLGAHTANSATGEFQVTSTLLFLLRRGERVQSVRPVVLASSLQRLLAGIAGVSRIEKDVPGSASGAGMRLPHVLVRGLRVVA